MLKTKFCHSEQSEESGIFDTIFQKLFELIFKVRRTVIFIEIYEIISKRTP
jgi:hypothetical protein